MTSQAQNLPTSIIEVKEDEHLYHKAWAAFLKLLYPNYFTQWCFAQHFSLSRSDILMNKTVLQMDSTGLPVLHFLGHTT